MRLSRSEAARSFFKPRIAFARLLAPSASFPQCTRPWRPGAMRGPGGL